MAGTRRASTRTNGTRENARGSQRRAELLTIAANLFATRGFLATTVRDIADEAGILSGSLYHHFDSKESMVDEILREFLDYQQRSYDDILGEAEDARTAVIELVRQSFRAMPQYRSAIAIFQNEANHLAQFERFAYLDKAAAEFERMWIRVLQDGQEQGLFRPDLNVKLVYRFIRDTVWTAVHWYNPRGRLTANVIADEYVKLVCHGLMEA
ncbi:TetR family transcriptional regulator [Allosaccharopolyspora coralli]|uniref:TetR family transcriptional regulator n=1 Tax=Allosaccharopolyspora coralli TaxID=2665642 RepID=A0A5Q3Q935_9PSEU|nr:TetR/AcrR family transcriptional regulator [Allosaccharopolyspora coralli]QGK70340.1 TetR family transcriptional regulator [Allosaccharopolyspora coralli]